MIACPKPRLAERSGAYLRFVRSLPCFSCGGTGGQAHHEGPRGLGRKTSDFRTVPICWRCHDQINLGHREGRLSVEAVREAQIETLVGFVCGRLPDLLDDPKDEPKRKRKIPARPLPKREGLRLKMGQRRSR